jgi:hypothetical protein
MSTRARELVTIGQKRDMVGFNELLEYIMVIDKVFV